MYLIAFIFCLLFESALLPKKTQLAQTSWFNPRGCRDQSCCGGKIGFKEWQSKLLKLVCHHEMSHILGPNPMITSRKKISYILDAQINFEVRMSCPFTQHFSCFSRLVIQSLYAFGEIILTLRRCSLKTSFASCLCLPEKMEIEIYRNACFWKVANEYV